MGIMNLLARPQLQNDFVVQVNDKDWTTDQKDLIASQTTEVDMDLVNMSLVLKIRQNRDGSILGLIAHVLEKENKVIDSVHVLPARGKNYECVFKMGELIDHNCHYDYASTKTLVHVLTFQFEDVDIHNRTSNVIKLKPKKKRVLLG